MSKPVIAVLVATLVALILATLWVPVATDKQFVTFPGGDKSKAITRFEQSHEYGWVWDHWQPYYHGGGGRFRDTQIVAHIAWAWLAVTHALIVAFGGLLALFFHARNRRRRADTVPSA